jgi:hypothetical protein
MAHQSQQKPQQPAQQPVFALTPAYNNQRALLNYAEGRDANIYYKGCKALKGQKMVVLVHPSFWHEFKQR